MLTAYAPHLASAPARDTIASRFSNAQLARLAGVLYLLVALCGGFSELYVRAGLKSLAPSAVADGIRATAGLFRLAFVTDLLNITFFVMLGMALYVLLAPVNARIAATFVIFVAIAAAVMAANMLNHAAALVLATDPAATAPLGATTADALAGFYVQLHGHGYLIAQIFFGLWLLPLGYLVYRSGLFPKVLGILLMLGCVGYLADLAAIYMSPGFESPLSSILVLPAALGEFGFLGWLLIMGAKEARVR